MQAAAQPRGQPARLPAAQRHPPPAAMAAHQPPKRPQVTHPKGSQGSQAGSQLGKRQRGPSWTEAEIRDLPGLWSEEEVLQVMGSKRQNADPFSWLAEGLAARGHPVRTPDHVRSKVKELRQGYARAWERPADLGPPPSLAPFTGSSGKSWAPGTPPPLRPLLTPQSTSPSRPQRRSSPWRQALHLRGPPRSPPLGHQRRRRRGGSSSSDVGLHITLPSRSSSRASAHPVSPDRGSGPSAAPSEGPESAGKVSVVPESPPGPSLQASPSAEHRPAPGRGRRWTQHHPWTATDPQLLAILRRQLEVSEQHLRVEERRLHLQERVLAWRQEAWGAFMRTFERIADYLAPHATPTTALPAPPAPPTAPPAIAPPSTTEGPSAEGDLGSADTRQPYLPVRPAPSQPWPGLRPRRGSQLPIPSGEPRRDEPRGGEARQFRSAAAARMLMKR
ncbi:uncharacterized protein LOC142002161 [Carettochelys insculpta]|uniref:uncharacterized protein LOC142002161 n=1 Tax=Carettochelys insculpta TaxID=44489 RepID=UPI003EBAB438